MGPKQTARQQWRVRGRGGGVADGRRCATLFVAEIVPAIGRKLFKRRFDQHRRAEPRLFGPADLERGGGTSVGRQGWHGDDIVSAFELVRADVCGVDRVVHVVHVVHVVFVFLFFCFFVCVFFLNF